MARQPMRIEAIRDLWGGRVADAVNRAIERCGRDMADRPDVKGARTVTVQIQMTPLPKSDLDDRNMLGEMKITIKDSVPERRSAAIVLEVLGNGKLILNPDAPENPRQGTLDEVENG